MWGSTPSKAILTATVQGLRNLEDGIASTARLTIYAVLLGVWVVDGRRVRSPLCGPFEDALPCLPGEVDSERVHLVQIHFGRSHLHCQSRCMQLQAAGSVSPAKPCKKCEEKVFRL